MRFVARVSFSCIEGGFKGKSRKLILLNQFPAAKVLYFRYSCTLIPCFLTMFFTSVYEIQAT